jgi:hypothetical protein
VTRSCLHISSFYDKALESITLTVIEVSLRYIHYFYDSLFVNTEILDTEDILSKWCFGVGALFCRPSYIASLARLRPWWFHKYDLRRT